MIYKVQLYYHSSVTIEVKANDEEDAIEKARMEVSDNEILEGLMEDSSPDVEPIYDEYKDMLCENHRAKSARLSDELYHRFVKQICDEDAIEAMTKGKDPNSYEDKTHLNWVGMLERLFEIFREEGYDRVAEMNEEYHTFCFDKSLYEEPIFIDTDDYQFGYFLDKFKPLCKE